VVAVAGPATVRCRACPSYPKITFAEALDYEKMPFVKSLAYAYWQDSGFWLGYLNEFPDYWTQGLSLNDLKDHPLDLYLDLSK
jgi:hypothetical protein